MTAKFLFFFILGCLVSVWALVIFKRLLALKKDGVRTKGIVRDHDIDFKFNKSRIIEFTTENQEKITASPTMEWLKPFFVPTSYEINQEVELIYLPTTPKWFVIVQTDQGLGLYFYTIILQFLGGLFLLFFHFSEDFSLTYLR